MYNIQGRLNPPEKSAGEVWSRWCSENGYASELLRPTHSMPVYIPQQSAKSPEISAVAKQIKQPLFKQNTSGLSPRWQK